MGNVFSSAAMQPTGLCDVENSSSEQVFRSCGKVRTEGLSLIWGHRDEIGGRVSFAA